MSQVAEDAHGLISYYRGQVRPALSQAPELDLVPQLDRLADAIEVRIGRLVPLQLGFLGESQVGKSTLINALLDRRALPSGGVGPLTALESADVLTRLNFDTEGLRLFVAVTHLDDTARTRHEQQVSEAEEDGGPVPTLDAVFDGLRAQQVAVIRRQLSTALRRSRRHRGATTARCEGQPRALCVPHRGTLD